MKKSGLVALIAGGTGLVGGHLISELEGNMTYCEIRVLSRKPLFFNNPKIKVYLTDFKDINEISSLFIGVDVFYCSLGTTIKKTGSKEGLRSIDFELVKKLAEMAVTKGIPKMACISSTGAYKTSRNFYLKTKGEMEEALLQMDFKKLIIVRPSVILGSRNESRFGEKILLFSLVLFSFLLKGRLKKYRPIPAQYISRALIILISGHNNRKIYESDEIAWIGK
jgi:uncharacterized protein YbjT (DUF2867 family)